MEQSVTLESCDKCRAGIMDELRTTRAELSGRISDLQNTTAQTRAQLAEVIAELQVLNRALGALDKRIEAYAGERRQIAEDAAMHASVKAEQAVKRGLDAHVATDHASPPLETTAAVQSAAARSIGTLVMRHWYQILLALLLGLGGLVAGRTTADSPAPAPQVQIDPEQLRTLVVEVLRAEP
jgi:hypothetical protein